MSLLLEAKSYNAGVLNAFVYKAGVPGSPSTQHKGDAVSCQDPGKTGEVGMAIWTLFKDTLVQLSLTHKTHTDRNEAFANWARITHKRLRGMVISTSLGKLLLENTLRGQDR